MDKERNVRSASFSAGAALFAILVGATMFLTYVTVNLLITKTTTTGLKLLDYEGASGQPFLIISMILAACILIFSVLRIIRIPLFNTRLFSTIYALAGVALMVTSIVLMITVVNVKVGGSTVELFERGIGVILNLVFSVIVAICCTASYTSSD